MRKTALIFSLIVMFWYSDAAADVWTGKVAGVVDGDIIRISHPEKGVMKIMLYGVDARIKISRTLNRQNSMLRKSWKDRRLISGNM